MWRREEGAKGNAGEPCGSPCEVQLTNDGGQDWSKDHGDGGQGVGFSKSEELRENEEKINSGPFSRTTVSFFCSSDTHFSSI